MTSFDGQDRHEAGRGEPDTGARPREPESTGQDRRTETEDEADPRSRAARYRRALALGLAAASVGGGLAAGVATPSGNAGAVAKKPAPAPAPTTVTRQARRESWDLPVTRNDRVDFFIDFLKGKNHAKTQLWLERMGRYAPMIHQKLAERGMPRDLIYLAMIESGLDPNAYSKADAAGMWQFIAPTAERYGLEVSKYVDQRRDPLKATDAALDYLKDLHGRFGGSWYLAAAGYNTGEHRVERVLDEKAGGARGDESLFWKIMADLPQETRDYVPVMLAMGYIAKDPARYGFHTTNEQAPLTFEEVTVPGGTSLARVAHAAGVAPKVVEDLNPSLVRQMTPPGRDWSVRVPVGRQQQVAAAFQQSQAGSPSYAD